MSEEKTDNVHDALTHPTVGGKFVGRAAPVTNQESADDTHGALLRLGAKHVGRVSAQHAETKPAESVEKDDDTH